MSEFTAQEMRAKFTRDVSLSDHHVWLIGLVFAKWSTMQADFERIAHGLVDGDQELWDKFNTEPDVFERLKMINALRYEKLESEAAAEVNFLISRMWRVYLKLLGVFHDAWSHSNSGWIDPVEPGGTPLPPKWTVYFPLGGWKISEDALLALAGKIDNLHGYCKRFAGFWGDTHADGSMVSSEKIRTRFKIKDVGWVRPVPDWET